jgi:hypothetical protein
MVTDFCYFTIRHSSIIKLSVKSIDVLGHNQAWNKGQSSQAIAGHFSGQGHDQNNKREKEGGQKPCRRDKIEFSTFAYHYYDIKRYKSFGFVKNNDLRLSQKILLLYGDLYSATKRRGAKVRDLSASHQSHMVGRIHRTKES